MDAAEHESNVPLGRGAALLVERDWPAWKRRRFEHLARALWQTKQSPDAVLVLESAALFWGIAVLHEGNSVHVARRHGMNRRRYVCGGDASVAPNPPAVIRHGFELRDDEWVDVDGVRVCNLDRLVMDFARLRSPRVSVTVIDAVLARLSDADRRDRTATLQRARPIRSRWIETAQQMKGARGIRRARAILAHADPLSESAGESAVRWALLTLGLPEPKCQVEIPLGDGTSYFPDLLIEELRLIVEFDGALKFERGDRLKRLAAHQRRHDELVARGYVVIHLTWEDIVTADSLRRALVRQLGNDLLFRYNPRPELLERGFLG
ncbi:MAG TPA: hypothetical protein GX743_04295 [Actinomycetales bacterium]|nr:hypothetical protein [Actinomycetales bacterium]